MKAFLTPAAERDIRRLPADVRIRITERLGTINDPRAECPQLSGLPTDLRGLRKLRVGDYRVLLWPDAARQALIVYAIAHRREIYRRL